MDLQIALDRIPAERAVTLAASLAPYPDVYGMSVVREVAAR